MKYVYIIDIVQVRPSV